MSEATGLRHWLQSYPALSLSEVDGYCLRLVCTPEQLPGLARELVEHWQAEFATLLVEEHPDRALSFTVRYYFYAPRQHHLLELRIAVAPGTELPAISDAVHAADWHEREAWDLYGLRFTGHPFLGDFVLHDEDWPEGVDPMLHRFSARQRPAGEGSGEHWQPPQLLEEEGAIVFPVGPIWGDYNESGLWLLETPGEQIRYLHTRLFYKYRAVEKIAEGQAVDQAFLLSERFAGAAALAHSWAYCQAVERIAGCTAPRRAEQLRILFAELERARHHCANIAEICGSTALSVAKAMAQNLVEDWLRLSAQVAGHRYLFGLLCPGGLRQDLHAEQRNLWIAALARLRRDLLALREHLETSSSFLDRIEEMGTLTADFAKTFGVVGPIARASGRALDLRRHLPYGAYSEWEPEIPTEEQGDGYARLRIFFAETLISIGLMEEMLTQIADGPIRTECPIRAGHALAWVEAPSGATFHWLRLAEDGSVLRLRLGTPGFRNWHAFERAIQGAAFQDFPIILATWGLSVAENDR
ncbi:MAG: NADH-quinone oxidoreductase subunit C [Acidithiobacillus sp.]|nr:NADH-quinone oxidoreductase subunit C [Acidithiobacillus sp.]